MIYLFFDTETTGLPKNYKAPMKDIENWPRLVQLSFIVCYKKGENLFEVLEKQSFDFIIKPDGFEIPEEVSKIHGITHERAMAEGKDLKEVMETFRTYINKADILIGHNIEFDKKIVGAEYYRMGLGLPFENRLKEKKLFCTMLESTKICGLAGTHAGQNKWPRLVELYKFLFDKEFEGQHNALNDVTATMECYFELEKKL